jgi:hypothetical protein
MSMNTIGTPEASQEVKETSQDVRPHVLNGVASRGLHGDSSCWRSVSWLSFPASRMISC